MNDEGVTRDRLQPDGLFGRRDTTSFLPMARVVPGLILAVMLLVSAYMLVSHRARRDLLVDAVVGQVDLLLSVLALSTEDLLAQDRMTELDQLLRTVLEADEIYAAMLIDEDRHVRAGDALDATCMLRHLPVTLAGAELRGRADCATGVHWGAASVRLDDTWLVIAVQEVLLHRAVASALRRQLLLLVVLALTVAVALRLILGMARRLERAERFAMIGRLSGGLAHELGSPLSVIGMRAAAITQNVRAEPGTRQHAIAITHEVRRLTAFTQGLLHLSRRRGIVRKPVDVRVILEAATAELAPPARAAQIALEIVADEHAVFVEGDDALLTHAVRNIVRNAIQALADRPLPRWIRITLADAAPDVRITIEDNGAGVTADPIDSVFEPFHSTKAGHEGMGLGLPISRGIIVEHGGDIRVENVPAGGLRVRITLPRITDAGVTKERSIS